VIIAAAAAVAGTFGATLGTGSRCSSQKRHCLRKSAMFRNLTPNCENRGMSGNGYEIARELARDRSTLEPEFGTSRRPLSVRRGSICLELFQKLTARTARTAPPEWPLGFTCARQNTQTLSGGVFMSDADDRDWWLRRILHESSAPASSDPLSQSPCATSETTK